jgi:acetoin utilization protein AcuB
MRLEEIMNTRVHTVAATDTAAKAWELMRYHQIHHLVAVHRGRVVGVVSDRDLGGPHGGALRNGRIVAHLMTPVVLSASPDTTVRKAANMLRGYGIGCLPVMDGGKLAGMVTVSDLLDLVGRGAERPAATTKRWTLRHRGRGRRKMRRA